MLLVDALAENGYHVLEADNGPEGLALLQSTTRIDLLVTDVGLPGGINGRQADAGRSVQPNLKILFITGYAENAALRNALVNHGMHVITKPFSGEALVQKVHDMIDGSVA